MNSSSIRSSIKQTSDKQEEEVVTMTSTSPKVTTTFILPTSPRLESTSTAVKDILTTPPQNNNNNYSNNIASTSGSTKLVSTSSILNRIGRKLSQTKGSLVRRVSSSGSRNRANSHSGLGRSKSSSVEGGGGDVTPPVPILSSSVGSHIGVGGVATILTRSLTKSKGKEKEVTFNSKTVSSDALLVRNASYQQQSQRQHQLHHHHSQQLSSRPQVEEQDLELDGGEGTTSGDRTPMSRTTLNRRLGRSKSEGRRRNGQELDVIMGWGNESQKSGSKLYWEERLGVCWDGREQVHPDLDFVYSSNSDVLPPSARVVFASTLSTFQPRPPLRARLSLPAAPKVKATLSPAEQVKEDYLQACREEERLARGLPKEGVMEDQEGEALSSSVLVGGYEVGEDLDLTPIPTPKTHPSKIQYASSAILDSSSSTTSSHSQENLQKGRSYGDDRSESSSASIDHRPSSSAEEMSYSKLGARQSEESNTSLESLRVVEVRHRNSTKRNQSNNNQHVGKVQNQIQNLVLDGNRIGYNLKDEPTRGITSNGGVSTGRPKFETGLEGESENGHGSAHWRECE